MYCQYCTFRNFALGGNMTASKGKGPFAAWFLITAKGAWFQLFSRGPICKRKQLPANTTPPLANLCTQPPATSVAFDSAWYGNLHVQ